jgi:hypothetical protein
MSKKADRKYLYGGRRPRGRDALVNLKEAKAEAPALPLLHITKYDSLPHPRGLFALVSRTYFGLAMPFPEKTVP